MNTHLSWCNGGGIGQCVCGFAEKAAREKRARDGTDAIVADEIATWMEGLAGHFATPNERRDWYRGVAMDIRHMGPWKADAEYRRKNK